jgi:hypothetical protein
MVGKRERVSGVEPSNSPLMFSVCTLVTRPEQYAGMRESFAEAGFSPENTEFLTIDNSRGNALCAYRGINNMLDRARGKYVVVCHQDILLLGAGAADLMERLQMLDTKHPDWAVAGNSGINEAGVHLLHISDPHGENQFRGPLPARAQSLDENFLVLRGDAGIRTSEDLTGFHLYGTDLCLRAERAGRSAWIVDFHVLHLSGGRIDEGFFREQAAFEKHWGELLGQTVVRRAVSTTLLLRSGWTGRWRAFLRYLRGRRGVGRVLRLMIKPEDLSKAAS